MGPAYLEGGDTTNTRDHCLPTEVIAPLVPLVEEWGQPAALWIVQNLALRSLEVPGDPLHVVEMGLRGHVPRAAVVLCGGSPHLLPFR
jgi:hypothetical protein